MSEQQQGKHSPKAGDPKDVNARLTNKTPKHTPKTDPTADPKAKPK